MALLDDIRGACAHVAARSQQVTIETATIPAYASALAWDGPAVAVDPEVVPVGAGAEARAAFALSLDAVNFGSGWFPTLRKRPGRSGYFTIALALRRRFDSDPAFFTAERLRLLDARTMARTLGQDPDHALMAHYGAALRELGERVALEHDGHFLALVRAAGGSAERLAQTLASWPGWHDAIAYDGRIVPFYKRAQIAASDLHAAGLLVGSDLHRLTLFADNLVPHVLRIDGVLGYRPELAERIDGGGLLEHGSPEEVEIRACALHAVELMVAARDADLCAARVDAILWRRGGEPAYKALPRHRTRCTAY